MSKSFEGGEIAHVKLVQESLRLGLVATQKLGRGHLEEVNTEKVKATVSGNVRVCQ